MLGMVFLFFSFSIKAHGGSDVVLTLLIGILIPKDVKKVLSVWTKAGPKL